MSGPVRPGLSQKAINGAVGAVLTLGVCALTFVVVAAANAGPRAGLAGIASGTVVGLMAALVLGAVIGAVFLSVFLPAKGYAPEGRQLRSDDPLLAEPLRELEATRRGVVDVVTARVAWSVPIAAAAGVGFWAWLQGDARPPGLVELISYPFVAGLFAYLYSVRGQAERYRRVYKAKVLPVLAARLDLAYRPITQADVPILTRPGFIRHFDDAAVEDELHGSYRGLPVRLAPVVLVYGSGKRARTIFEGVIIEVELKNRLLGETALVPDSGSIGNLVESLRQSGAERVGLADPEFERLYEVYSTDQVMARALLTPDFMERLKALGGEAGRPVALASGRTFTLALPKPRAGELFQAPDFQRPADSHLIVSELADDIRNLLSTADLAIALDSATERAAETA